uniref:Uncharacterized protein n=1 Tax=Oryza glumipatula TaxID=40148 RepID=A0A0E0ASP6_9ORYZ
MEIIKEWTRSRGDMAQDYDFINKHCDVCPRQTIRAPILDMPSSFKEMSWVEDNGKSEHQSLKKPEILPTVKTMSPSATAAESTNRGGENTRQWQRRQAGAVDSPSLAYIRHLVESLERLNFDDACMHQLDDDASDLFSLQRPVFTRVPDDIVSAIDTLEEILS